MYLSKVEITFDSLTNFIKNEYLLADYEIKNQNKDMEEIEESLTKLKEEVKEKEDEYLQKQKEISTYLECKKTFIGKVKYFFKSDKKERKNKNKNRNEQNVVDKIDFKEIKTKQMVNTLNNLKVEGKTLIMLPEKNENVQKSSRNIEGVKTTLVNTINVYDLLKYTKLVVTVDTIKKLEEVYA